MSLCRSRDADYGSAFALGLLRHTAQAYEIEVNLEKRYQEDTSVQFRYLPVLRALEALNLGDPAKVPTAAKLSSSSFSSEGLASSLRYRTPIVTALLGRPK